MYERVKHVPGINAAALAAGATNGIVIDRYGALPAQPSGITAYTAYTQAAGIYLTGNILLSVGAASGEPTAQSVTLKLQESDASDGSGMEDVTGATISALTADNAYSAKDFDLAGLKRYIRVVVTVALTAGTSPKIPVAVAVALGDSNNDPAL